MILNNKPLSVKYGYTSFRRARPLQPDQAARALPLGYPFGGVAPMIAGPVALGDFASTPTLGKKKTSTAPGKSVKKEFKYLKKKGKVRIGKNMSRYLESTDLPEDFYYWNKPKQKAYAQQAKASQTQAIREARTQAEQIINDIRTGRLPPDSSITIPTVPFTPYGAVQKQEAADLEFLATTGLQNAISEARLNRQIDSVDFDFAISPGDEIYDAGGDPGASSPGNYYATDADPGAGVDWNSGVVYPPGYDPNPPISPTSFVYQADEGAPPPSQDGVVDKLGNRVIWVGGIAAAIVSGITLASYLKRRKRRRK